MDWHRRDPALPGLEVVLDELDRKTLGFEGGVAAAAGSPRLDAVAEVVRRVVVRGLIELSGNARASVEVRARVDAKLAQLAERFGAGAGAGTQFLAEEIRRHRERGRVVEGPALQPAPAPPGSLIGCQLSDPS